MAEPKRIKLERRPGWRMPPGAVIVARRSDFANPFPVADFGSDHAAAVERYREWLDDPNGQPVWCKTKWYPRPSREEIVAALRGHDLACWCRLDEPCHADVLLELANADLA